MQAALEEADPREEPRLPPASAQAALGTVSHPTASRLFGSRNPHARPRRGRLHARGWLPTSASIFILMALLSVLFAPIIHKKSWQIFPCAFHVGIITRKISPTGRGT